MNRNLNAWFRQGCKSVCKSAVMMKPIMTPRAAAVALAASALFAAPALAEHTTPRTVTTDTAIQTVLNDVLDSNSALSVTIGQTNYDRPYRGYSRRAGYDGDRDDRRYRTGHYDRRDRGYNVNDWGQTRWQVNALKREAVQACRQTIHEEGHRAGFADVEFEKRARWRQSGPYRFRVNFEEVEFERRHGRKIEREISCVFRRGTVSDLRGMPRPRQYGHRHDSYSGYDRSYSDLTPSQWRVYRRGHADQDNDRGQNSPIDDNYRH